MTASLLNGAVLANELKENIKEQVLSMTQAGQTTPGLAVILLGDDPASLIYVQNKRKACLEVGFNSYSYDLPTKTSEKELLALIDSLNQDESIHGILVQLPLPNHIDTTRVIERIHPKKDVDGFHPYNLGRLAQGNPLLRPCTPYGVIQLLQHYQLPLQGKHAVVIGASNIVGRPMALEFLLAKATVTICHRATQNLEQHVRSADILVVAAGSYDIVKTTWLHQQHIVIDIGIHRHANGSLHGDVDFARAREQVAWISPVPGGVGPMTISTLLQNNLLAAKNTRD